MPDLQHLLEECRQLDSQGKWHDAIARLSEALASDSHHRLFYERGYRYEEAGEFHRAHDDYSDAIRLAPETMKYWVARGRLLCHFSQTADAIEDFAMAIWVDPNSAVPHQNLSLCFLYDEDYAEASYHAEKAIQIDPADAFSHAFLGYSQLGTNDYASAMKQFQIAVGLAPHVPKYWQDLGRAYRKTGDLGNAEACYRKAIEIEPSPVSWITLASLQLDLGEPQRALESLDSVKEGDLENVDRVLADGYRMLASGYRAHAEGQIGSGTDEGAR